MPLPPSSASIHHVMEASTSLEWEDLALFTGNAAFRPLSGADPMIGLRLGQHQEYTSAATTLLISSSSIPAPAKRSRASYHNMQNPCCQVEGCNLDLKLAKDYHRRHRICDTHSKSPKVIVAGMERRFCQQCSRFHDLSEFDDKKRSCRRRLSDHNARRRRVQSESVHLTSPGLSPSLYDQRQQNVLLNGLPVSLPNSNTSMSRYGLIRPRGVDGTLHGDGNGDGDVLVLHNLHMDPERQLSSIQRSNPRILDQCKNSDLVELRINTLTHAGNVHVGSSNSSMAHPELVSVHSLLSSNTWSMNEGESAETMVHGNYSPADQSHYLTLFHSSSSSNINGVDEGPPISHLHNAGPSHHQQYQLFKDPYDSPTFYSAQRTL